MAAKTALLVIDPLNDFMHPEGKLYPALRESIEATNTVPNLKKLVDAARSFKVPVYYGLHQPYHEGVFDGWKHIKASHKAIRDNQVFARGTWGAEIHKGFEPDMSNGDVVASRHWNSSSFSNTDLDYQLRQREITHVVLAGLVTNTCIESTARHATELTDATAGFSQKLKVAATDLVWPTIVDEVISVDDWIAQRSK
ncbi:isochorismatase hydrolase [Fusarium beomiforme]|uniref:Isochorismatase hydrolase n=1 Tax=Fusarium beomiforme TaxID=44412 RepID=A0A9P5AL35_9HYPO|nr:isochorismatase hydrolase [Fusarium beomiforme]